jgi:hypothetical protein
LVCDRLRSEADSDARFEIWSMSDYSLKLTMMWDLRYGVGLQLGHLENGISLSLSYYTLMMMVLSDHSLDAALV